MRIYFLSILLIITTIAKSQFININIYHDKPLSDIILTPVTGEYEIYSDSNLTYKLKRNDIIYISLLNDSIEIKNLDKIIGFYKSFKIIGKKANNSIRIKPIKPEGKIRVYDDNFFVEIRENNLFLINNVDLENYIAGVVEAEGGSKSSLEYYKTQAIICRTYALRNFNRFIDQGYNLCDDVNCQAYHGKSLRSSDIIRATKATKGLIIVDTTLNLINAVFHSNSGGETVPAEIAWQKPLSYLKAVTDTFAIHGKRYNWKKTIPLSRWKSYLRLNGFNISKNIYINPSEYEFTQIHRKQYYKLRNDSIELKQIRKDFKLRSTFFSIKLSGNNLIFTGRGYGHGVGLCQEGAMYMANNGYDYNKIIKFYYRNTYIVSLTALDFFRKN